jgi:hypothetical protein
MFLICKTNGLLFSLSFARCSSSPGNGQNNSSNASRFKVMHCDINNINDRKIIFEGRSGLSTVEWQKGPQQCVNWSHANVLLFLKWRDKNEGKIVYPQEVYSVKSACAR